MLVRSSIAESKLDMKDIHDLKQTPLGKLNMILFAKM